MEQQRLTEQNAAVWDAFVGDHPDATVFHSWGWLTTIEEVFGYEPRHTLAVESQTGEPIGAVPGFVVPDPLGRSVLNPFCEYGFPLLAPEVSPVAVLESLDTSRPFGARIIKETPWSGVTGYSAAGYGAVETGVAIRVSLSDGDPTAGFDSEVRRAVQTATENGLTVRRGTVDTYYELYRATMKRLGSPPFPRQLFELLAERLETTILVAETDGVAVAGVLRLDWADEAIIWGNVSREAFWDSHPNHLLYASAIERAARTGLSVIDFGRSRRGSGVHAFKTGFGGVEWPLVSLVSPPHRTSRASVDQYELFTPLTKRLASIITHPTVGPHLKRFIHE